MLFFQVNIGKDDRGSWRLRFINELLLPQTSHMTLFEIRACLYSSLRRDWWCSSGDNAQLRLRRRPGRSRGTGVGGTRNSAVGTSIRATEKPGRQLLQKVLTGLVVVERIVRRG